MARGLRMVIVTTPMEAPYVAARWPAMQSMCKLVMTTSYMSPEDILKQAFEGGP